MEHSDSICLSGVRVNNLQNLSITIPHNQVTVICGLSGSGKTSLAFDTLYAEGQRRYVETFSASARQFLDRIERPQVDSITGLPPAIACRQQGPQDHLRSSVGNRTEILDSLRLLFARFGSMRCPDCGIRVEAATPERVVSDVRVAVIGQASRLLICSKPPEWKTRTWIPVNELLTAGLTRIIHDDRLLRLADLPADSRVSSNSLIVLDRIQSESSDERLAESVRTALGLSGSCIILSDGGENPAFPDSCRIDNAIWRGRTWTSTPACPKCDLLLPALTSDLLNERSPLGACPECKGTGEQSAAESPGKRRRAGNSSTKKHVHAGGHCTACHGDRLNRFARALEWHGRSFREWLHLEATDLSSELQKSLATVPDDMRHAVKALTDHLNLRLQFLVETGLGYLSMGRTLQTLSGGEAQRVVLTSILGSGLVGTLFVLDEPTTGLHPNDAIKVLGCIRKLQQNGNTVVMVEHDLEAIRMADHVIELGPGAGDQGGQIVFQGTSEQLLSGRTITGIKLQQVESSRPGRETSKDAVLRNRRVPEQWLEVNGVTIHNLQNLNVEIPLGVFCSVSGVSGSGKSSLIKDALYSTLVRQLHPDRADTESALAAADSIASIAGVEQIESVLMLDQRPIRRSVRSIPATWIGVFDEIRILMAETHEARRRNYSRMMFSFNAARGGRCPVCEGRGVITVPMQFLADIETTCEECGGQRFRPEVIEVRYRDRSIYDILNMTADEAFRFFNGHHRIQTRLNAMRQSGLGYLRLGQSLATLSGGESQRLRLAAMLAGIPLTEGETAALNRKSSGLVRSGRTLFLLDEPSCGLHPHDIDALVTSLDFLVQTGHSVVVIEHDPQLLRHADWNIELGPGPGRFGGRVVHSGPVTE